MFPRAEKNKYNNVMNALQIVEIHQSSAYANVQYDHDAMKLKTWYLETLNNGVSVSFSSCPILCLVCRTCSRHNRMEPMLRMRLKILEYRSAFSAARWPLMRPRCFLSSNVGKIFDLEDPYSWPFVSKDVFRCLWISPVKGSQHQIKATGGGQA